MDDDFVETSDIEELAEFGKDITLPSTPHGRKDSVWSEPRKRIKVFHEPEAISSSPAPYHNSPLRDRQNVNKPRSYRKENMKSPNKESHEPEQAPADSIVEHPSSTPSPGTPQSAHQSSDFHHSPPLPRTLPVEIAMVTPTDNQAAELVADQRYSFRKRNAAQLAPYTVDLARYRHALKSNPDAIVKMRQIERQLEQQQLHKHPDDHYEDDAFGDPLDSLEDADWEERERRRRKRLEKTKEVPSFQDLSHYPTILQDHLSTDEEEKELDAASKMARKILRAKEREERSREKEEAKRRRKEEEEERRRLMEKTQQPKPYPMSEPRDNDSRRHSIFSESHYTVEPQQEGNSPRYLSPPFPSFHSMPGPSTSKTKEQSAVQEEGGVLRDYFNDVDFDMYDSPQENLGCDAQSHPSPRSVVNLGDTIETHSENASSDLSDLEGLDLSSRKKRILFRMMPKVMAKQLVRRQADGKDRRSPSPNSNVEGDHPLLPGQSRVRPATNLKDIQDIRGDSESDDDGRSDPSPSSSSPSITSIKSDSASDSVEILHTYRPPPRHRTVEPEVAYVDSDSEGDEDIQFFVQNTRPHKKRTKLRDQSLINYMLPRVHTTGGSYRRKTSRSSKYKYDIITGGGRGHGREHQTLLSFDERKPKERRHFGAEAIIPDHSRPFTRTGSRNSSDPRGPSTPGEIHVHAQDDNHRGGKEKEKSRKAKARTNGIYNFNSVGKGRITTGRRTDAAFFTVDLEDEAFHQSLAPIVGSGPRYEPPPPRKRKQPVSQMSSTIGDPPAPENRQLMNITEGNMKKFTRDLGIKHISSGRSFNQSSYIRKGWLHELVNVASSDSLDNHPTPPSTILCRFELNSTMGVGALCTTLPKMLDALFECATDILDADSDLLSDEWKPGFRVTCQLISWYFQNAQEAERTAIRQVVDKEVSRITDLIDKPSLSFIEKPILSLCWFLVELSARVSVPIPTSHLELSSSLRASSRILMQLLLRIGVQKSADVIQSDERLDEAILVHYAVEIWVCLIHLLGIPKEGASKSKLNPFWSIFMDALPSSLDNADLTHSFKISEDVWLSVFTLCALSQFSVHGMATLEPRLPAHWDLVAYGLKSICLTETEEQRRLQLPFLRKRDRYVALVVTRCEHLHKFWHWRLDEGASMFNQISEIFRSRNFANLRFEDDKLPKFFKHTDWRLLEMHDSTDTIFSIFLKLIMSADRDEVNMGRKSAKLKKLLSLAVPLRPLSFSANRPPTSRELSMFFNRLSAIALALHLDPSDPDDRLERARHYAHFETADIKARHAIICGLERLCHLMVKREMNLGSMLDWIEDLSRVVDAELKVFSSEHPAPCRAENLMDPCIQLVKHLFETVGRIVASYANASRFFEPLLLGKLTPILTSSVMKSDTLREEFALLMDTIFAARAKVLPKPTRPFSPEEINEESQNYFEGFDDFDFAAIGDLPGNDHAANILEKDRIFRQNVDGKLRWVIFMQLRQHLASPPPATSWKAYSNECDRWLRLWLCFNDVKQSTETKWNNAIHVLDRLLVNAQDNDNDDPWIHRVNLSIMFQLLQLDPMAYLSFMNRALEVFFRALVSESVSLENEYVSCLLSIDCLRHPLFAGAATKLPPRVAISADYQFSPDQFLELRLSLIRVIFHNIEQSLSNEDVAEMEARKSYIDFCHNMFAWMRRVRSRLLQKTGEAGDKATEYTRFCLQVLQTFQENPLLRTQHRLEFFLGWTRTLVSSPP